MKENVTVFTKSAIFYFSIWRIFGSFSNRNNLKSGHGKSKLLLLSCGEYLALGTFLFFHLIFHFFELLRKKSQNLDFFQEKHIFCTFLSEIQKIIH